MTSDELKRLRLVLGLTQQQVAERLGTTRMSITRYENGKRRISGVVEVAIKQLQSAALLPLAGVVSAGRPLEAILQTELVEVPPGMLRGGTGGHFALRVKGESMRDEGILPGDLVIVHKQVLARNGQTVVALVNNEATVKKYYRKDQRIELHPANATMAPIIVTPQDEFRIEGVVIGVIRYCRL